MSIIVKNGFVTFTDPNVNDKDVEKLFNDFRVDLLDCQIPHYRPVAFGVTGPVLSVPDVLTKYAGLNLNVAEIAFKLMPIIASKQFGLPLECMSRSTMSSDFVKKMSYMNIFSEEEDMSYYSHMTGKSNGGHRTVYQVNGMGAAVPKFLMRYDDLFPRIPTNMRISVVLAKDKGFHEFSSRLSFQHKGVNLWSIRSEYALYDYIRCRVDYLQGRTFRLDYKVNLDESVLAEILDNYFTTKIGGG